MSLKIALISNITLEPFLQSSLKKRILQQGLDMELTTIDYAEYDTCKNKADDADYTIVALSFEFLFPNVANDILSGNICRTEILDRSIEICRKLYNSLKEKCRGTILWLGFEDYYCQYGRVRGSIPVDFMLVDETNLVVYKMMKPGDVYLDLKRMIADAGIDSVYDWRGKYRWNAPYTRIFVDKICEEITRQCIIKGGMGNMKKCLVLDCDNVLWGGILAEDGISGILLGEEGDGRRYKDFQRFLLYLYYHGIILSVCSKNNLADVLQVFKEHESMVIKEEHIACIEAGWGSKADSVRKIGDRLGIGEDSMVFIDDSINEIQEVCSRISGIEGIQFGDGNLYKAFSCFYLEDADPEMAEKRTLAYQMDRSRSRLAENLESRESYIAELRMKVDIHRVHETELRRISELSRRVNRCTNGTRFSLEELKRQVNNSDYELYSIIVSDRYSNLGLVGSIGIKNGVLDLFALSCRAFGRGLEEKMIDQIKECRVHQFKFISTGKNQQLYRFFIERGGLTVLSD